MIPPAPIVSLFYPCILSYTEIIPYPLELLCYLDFNGSILDKKSNTWTGSISYNPVYNGQAASFQQNQLKTTLFIYNGTFSFWINVPASSNGIIMSYGNGDEMVIQVNQLTLQFMENDYIMYQTAISADTWTHIVVIRDGYRRSYYINGVLLANASAPIAPSQYEFTFGSSVDLSNAFSGLISDFRVYQIGISDMNILKLYEYIPSTFKIGSNGFINNNQFGLRTKQMTSSTMVGSNATIGEWIQLQWSASVPLIGYQINSVESIYFPVSWIVVGSNNGTTWTLLDTQLNQVMSNGNANTYPINSTTNYKYARIILTKLKTDIWTLENITMFSWVLLSSAPNFMDLYYQNTQIPMTPTTTNSQCTLTWSWTQEYMMNSYLQEQLIYYAPFNNSLSELVNQAEMIISGTISYTSGKVNPNSLLLTNTAGNTAVNQILSPFKINNIPFTIATWINVTSFPTGNKKSVLVNYSLSTADYIYVSVSATGVLSFMMGTLLIGIGTVVLSTWYHIAIVVNDTSTSCYLNGLKVGNQITTGITILNSRNGSKPFYGSINEFYIYSSLSDSDRIELYNRYTTAPVYTSNGYAQLYSNGFSDTDSNRWIQLKIASPMILTGYQLTCNHKERFPYSWMVMASTDELNWVSIDRRIDQTGVSITQTYLLNVTTAYRYYRFVFINFQRTVSNGRFYIEMNGIVLLSNDPGFVQLYYKNSVIQPPSGTSSSYFTNKPCVVTFSKKRLVPYSTTNTLAIFNEGYDEMGKTVLYGNRMMEQMILPSQYLISFFFQISTYYSDSTLFSYGNDTDQLYMTLRSNQLSCWYLNTPFSTTTITTNTLYYITVSYINGVYSSYVNNIIAGSFSTLATPTPSPTPTPTPTPIPTSRLVSGDYFQIQYPNPFVANSLKLGGRKNLQTNSGINSNRTAKNMILAGSTNGTVWYQIGGVLSTNLVDGSLTTFPFTNQNAYSYYRVIATEMNSTHSSYWEITNFVLMNGTLPFPPIALTGPELQLQSYGNGSYTVTSNKSLISHLVPGQTPYGAIGNLTPDVGSLSYISVDLTTNYSNTGVYTGTNTTLVNNALDIPQVRIINSICLSMDGTYQSMATDNGILYTNDSGTTWNIPNFSDGIALTNWSSISMSNSGQYQTATLSNGGIYYSFNNGQLWNPTNAPPNRWTSIIVSEIGNYQYATVKNGSIYMSSTYGQSWVAVTSPKIEWKSITTSNGQNVLALGNQNSLYQSVDYGKSWVLSSAPRNLAWTGISMSSDGVYQSASVLNSTLQIYSNPTQFLIGNWIQVELDLAAIVSAIQIVFIGTIPMTYLILGSNDNITWYYIVSSTNNYISNQYIYTNQAYPYMYYRFLTNESFRLSKFILWGLKGPLFNSFYSYKSTSNSLSDMNNGFVCKLSWSWDSGSFNSSNPIKIVTNDTSTDVIGTNTNLTTKTIYKAEKIKSYPINIQSYGEWIQIKIPECIPYYFMIQPRLNKTSICSSFILLASTDSISWVLLGQFCNQTWNNNPNLYYVYTTHSYSYYRMVFTNAQSVIPIGRINVFDNNSICLIPNWRNCTTKDNTLLYKGTVIAEISSSITGTITGNSISKSSKYPYVLTPDGYQIDSHFSILTTNIYTSGPTYSDIASMTSYLSGPLRQSIYSIYGEWIQIQTPSIRPTGIKMYPNSIQKMCQSFLMLGSKDGVAWYYLTSATLLTWSSLTPAFFYVNSLDGYSYFRFIITQSPSILDIGGIILVKENDNILSNLTVDSTGYLLKNVNQTVATVSTSWMDIPIYENSKNPALVFIEPYSGSIGFNAPYEYSLTLNGNVLNNSPSTDYYYP